MYGTVSWLNALDEIGKLKKGIDLVCTLFVFKSGVVLLAQEHIKGKKKPKVRDVGTIAYYLKIYLIVI